MFTIVKHASDLYWTFYFEKDPKETGVDVDMSMHSTYTGRTLGVRERYNSLEEAESTCKTLNKLNPSGGYGVCLIN